MIKIILVLVALIYALNGYFSKNVFSYAGALICPAALYVIIKSLREGKTPEGNRNHSCYNPSYDRHQQPLSYGFAILCWITAFLIMTLLSFLPISFQSSS